MDTFSLFLVAQNKSTDKILLSLLSLVNLKKDVGISHLSESRSVDLFDQDLKFYSSHPTSKEYYTLVC